MFSLETSSKVVCSLFLLTDENRCLKANAKSCGECIQAGPNCGWCTNSVSKIAQGLSVYSLVIYCCPILYPQEMLDMNFHLNQCLLNEYQLCQTLCADLEVFNTVAPGNMWLLSTLNMLQNGPNENCYKPQIHPKG